MEVLHKMTVQADLLTNFCECYDLKPHATNIFQDIVNSLGAYVHSLFVNPQLMNQTGMSVLYYAINSYKINNAIYYTLNSFVYVKVSCTHKICIHIFIIQSVYMFFCIKCCITIICF